MRGKYGGTTKIRDIGGSLSFYGLPLSLWFWLLKTKSNETEVMIMSKEMRDNILVMTLCKRCADNFREGGYNVIKKGYEAEKSDCDYCSRGMGFTYGVFNRQKKAVREFQAI